MSRPPAEQRVKGAEFRAREEESERQRRVWASCSWFGVFTDPLTLTVTWFCFVGCALGLVALAGLWIRGLPDWVWIASPFVIASIGTVALARYARKVAPIAEQRERAWLHTLPYHVEYYFEVLGDDPGENSRRIELEITFVGERPAAKRLNELLGNGWKANATGAIMTPGVRSATRNTTSNLAFRTWFHRFTETNLAKLHAVAPFNKIAIFNALT